MVDFYKNIAYNECMIYKLFTYQQAYKYLGISQYKFMNLLKKKDENGKALIDQYDVGKIKTKISQKDLDELKAKIIL